MTAAQFIVTPAKYPRLSNAAARLFTWLPLLAFAALLAGVYAANTSAQVHEPAEFNQLIRLPPPNAEAWSDDWQPGAAAGPQLQPAAMAIPFPDPGIEIDATQPPPAAMDAEELPLGGATQEFDTESTWFDAMRSPFDPFIEGWDPWTGSLELGFNGSQGNSKTMAINAGFDAKYTTDWVEHVYGFRFVDRQNDGVLGARNSQLNGRVEWPFAESPFTYFIRGSNEYDALQAWEFRLSAGTGLGYKVPMWNEATTLSVRFGGSCSKEVNSPREEYTPELLSSVEFCTQITERQKLAINFEYFPDVTAFSQYRFNGDAAYEVTLDPENGLSLKMGVVQRYQSYPSGKLPSDTDYSAALKWCF